MDLKQHGLFIVSWFLLHPAWSEQKPMVLVRESQTPVSLYYQNLSFHPGALTPMKVYQLEFEKNSLELSQAQKLQNLLKLNNQDWKEYAHSLKPSYELFAMLRDYQGKTSSGKHLDCVAQENLLRALRKQKGGEDLTLWINGKDWSCEEWNDKDPIYVLILSSAWVPIRFIGYAHELFDFLKEIKAPKSWVEKNGTEYRWSALGPLTSFRRSIVFSHGRVEPDNWFHPSQLTITQASVWKEASRSAVFWGLAIVGGLVLYNQLRGKTIVIEF